MIEEKDRKAIIEYRLQQAFEIGEPFSLFAYSKADWEAKQKITPFYTSVTKEGIRL